jgi:hypothetical protein
MPTIDFTTVEGRVNLLFRRLTPLSPTEISKLTTDKYGTICARLRQGLQAGVYERRRATSKYKPRQGWANPQLHHPPIWVYCLKGDTRNTADYQFIKVKSELNHLTPPIRDGVTHGIQFPEHNL